MYEVYNTFTGLVICTCELEVFAHRICQMANDKYGNYTNNTWTYMYRRAK